MQTAIDIGINHIYFLNHSFENRLDLQVRSRELFIIHLLFPCLPLKSLLEAAKQMHG